MGKVFPLVGAALVAAVFVVFALWPYHPVDATGAVICGAGFFLTLALEKTVGVVLSDARGRRISDKEFSIKRIGFAVALVAAVAVLLLLFFAYLPLDWDSHFREWPFTQ